MSQSLDELLERMEREKKPAMTIEQLRQLTHEEHTRDSAMAQMAGQLANNQAAQQQNAYTDRGWPSLANLGKGAKISVPKTKHRKYFVELDGHSDHDVEADEIVINGPFLVFMKDGNVELIVTERQVVSVKESEE